MLARSKWNSIENKIFEALKNSEISHEEFVTIINAEKKFKKRIKRSTTRMSSQRNDTEKNNLMEEGKK